jgi:hypothetical protein
MRKMVILLVLFLLLNSTAAFAESGDGFYAIGDLAIARPLGIASIVIGGAAFIASFPFALTSGSIKDTADLLVGEPFRFTFKRPLGDFRQGSYDKPLEKTGKGDRKADGKRHASDKEK